MNLKEYVKSLTRIERIAYAERSGTTDAYLSQITGGHSVPSPALAKALAEQSGWRVHPSEILPLFERIPAKK